MFYSWRTLHEREQEIKDSSKAEKEGKEGWRTKNTKQYVKKKKKPRSSTFGKLNLKIEQEEG